MEIVVFASLVWLQSSLDDTFRPDEWIVSSDVYGGTYRLLGIFL